MELEELRNQIDQIDSSLCDLFTRRMKVVTDIAECKKKSHTTVFDPSRERDILLKISKQAGNEFEGYARLLYHTIFDLSESYQAHLLAKESEFYKRLSHVTQSPPKAFPKRATVACQGCEGAYSQQSAERLFELPEIMFTQNFDGVFRAVDSGLCEFGMLPIENSTAGSVNAVYDLMMRYDVSIVRSVRLKIDHNLLTQPGAKLEEVREIYSHEQAINQCSEFLSSLQGVRVIPVENTAVAARRVAESHDVHKASLSSRLCADIYRLQTLKSSVQNRDNNYTRFICISKSPTIYPGANRTSLMMVIPHKPGTLFKILSRFNATGVNLVKLESRPIPNRDFEFLFYFDIEASVYSNEFVSLMCELEQSSEQFKYFGTYLETI